VPRWRLLDIHFSLTVCFTECLRHLESRNLGFRVQDLGFRAKCLALLSLIVYLTECLRHLESPVGSSKFFPPAVNFSFDPDALPGRISTMV
jgi:hypothetical protein